MTQGLAWLFLVASGVFDVGWAVSVKYADGYTRVGWSLLSLILLVAFIGLLGQALKVLPVGTAYAVWTGIGAVGSFAAGVILFDESLDMQRVGSIALILIGIVGLKLGS
jgi:quaternary ammonium compound-resistance protein SugE